VTRSAAPQPVGRPLPWLQLALALILLAALLLCVSIGAVSIPLDEIARALGRGITGTGSSPLDTIIWQVRLPRVLLAAAVGAVLAVAGVAYQGVFRNPLADPYLLGVASGASFGAALSIVFASSIPLLAVLGLPLLSFLFALLTVLLVISLARQGGRLPVLSLILAGAVLGAVFTAGTSFLMLLAREQAAGIIAWLLGSFGKASFEQLLTLLPFLLLLLAVTALGARALNVLQLGEEQAGQLGVNVQRTMLVLLAVATLAVAVAVSVSGIIGFVGLMVPHAVRLLSGGDHRRLVPLSALLGATLLVLADLLARTVIAPAELPIGIVTALAGGPFFLWLLQRRRSTGT
jgi:iron complex transport system permease protein